MRPILTAGLVWCVLLGVPALAAELQLVDGGAENSTRQLWLEGSSRRVLVNEPDLTSEKPLWFALELGNGKDRFIAAVADESKGTGTGYDRLFVDVNNNGDLTDDKPIKLAKSDAENPPNISLEFEPVAVKVKYHDGTDRPLRVKIALQGYRGGGDDDRTQWSANYSIDQHLEGQVAFGDKKMLVGIYDAAGQGPVTGDANGCFDDFGLDRVRIDLNGDGKLDAEKEDFPLSKVIACDGKLWEVEIDSAGRKADVRPCKLPAGRLELRGSFDAGATVEAASLQLLSSLGYIFRCDLAKDKTVSVPAAKYSIEDGSLTLADTKGSKWTAKFTYPKTVRLKADEAVPVAIGKPLMLKPVVKDLVRAGSRTRVTHVLMGAGGETYTGLMQGDKQLPPSVTITDSEGVKIAEGKMEFG
ncbi:MAG: hypothetical protein NTW87_17955 [Planctomycetota bacterium]|nr:hypothetical protein [Planctomycetota bacterium]